MAHLTHQQQTAQRFRHWLTSPFTLIALGAFAAGVLVVGIGFYLTSPTFDLKAFIAENYSNFGIELISIAFTVLVIDGLHRHHDERERKRELVVQMGSPDHDFAIEAVRLLRLKGWLEDGSLEGAMLPEADLRGAMLNDADLQHADLSAAKLQQASLHGADLRMARLKAADLREAKHIQNAIFDVQTILPDGTAWTPARDLREFTHPEDWQAEQFARQSLTNGGKSPVL